MRRQRRAGVGSSGTSRWRYLQLAPCTNDKSRGAAFFSAMDAAGSAVLSSISLFSCYISLYLSPPSYRATAPAGRWMLPISHLVAAFARKEEEGDMALLCGGM